MQEQQEIQTNVVKPKLSIFQNEVEYRLLSVDTENKLDSKISDIESFMKSNDGFGKTDEIKDSLYGESKLLWNQYAATLRDAKFTFYLNRKQFGYITTLLRDKLEYDVNTVFLAIELTNMFGEWSSIEKHKDDVELKGFSSDATEITYMYHLIAKHTVKGLTRDTYLFAEILRKIADVSKIINYYDASAKNLSTEIQNWVASFEPEESSSDTENIPSEEIKFKASPKKLKQKIEE